MFRIYYADRVVEGRTAEDWQAAPDTGVQAVVRFPRLLPVRWAFGPLQRSVQDRDLWTGDDFYDPFGWGQKEGSLLPDAEYFLIWEQACGDTNP